MMKKVLLLAAMFFSMVTVFAADLELTSGAYRSRFIASEEVNSYKNTLRIKVNNVANDHIYTIRKYSKDAQPIDQMPGVATIYFYSGGEYVIEDYNYLGIEDPNGANRYDNLPFDTEGEVDEGGVIEIPDYFTVRTDADFNDILARGGDKNVKYTYKLYDEDTREFVGTYVVPVYAAHVTTDIKNGYSLADIQGDTDHHLAPAQAEITTSEITAGANIASWKFINKEGAFVSDAPVFTDGITDIDQRYVGEFTVLGPDGWPNTYGTNTGFVMGGAIAATATKSEKSTYTFTGTNGEKDCHYYKNVLRLTFQYAPIGNLERLHPSITTGGYRIWRDCETSAEEFQEFVGRATDYKFYETLGVVGRDDNKGREMVSGIGSDVINGENGNYNTTGVFGSSSNEPSVTYLVRAYYYMTQAPYNPDGAPALRAPKVAEEEEKVYFIAESTLTVTFPEDLITGVNDVAAAKQICGVKYYNVAGAESNEPFSGMNIVVTRYTDGSTSSVKMVK